jgi:hypothetical protein
MKNRRKAPLLAAVILSALIAAGSLAGCAQATGAPLSPKEMQTMVAATVGSMGTGNAVAQAMGTPFPGSGKVSQPTEISTPTLAPTSTDFPTRTPIPTFAGAGLETPVSTPSRTPLSTRLPSTGSQSGNGNGSNVPPPGSEPIDPALVTPQPPPIIAAKPIENGYAFNGQGPAMTQAIALPSGKVRIRWQYTGAVGETRYLNDAVANREKEIQELDQWYRFWTGYYTERVQRFRGQGKPKLVDYFERELSRIYQEYKGKTIRVNTRYAEDMGKHITWFALKIGRVSEGDAAWLDYGDGASANILYYQSDGGEDFYFLIDTPGVWEIEITRPPE